MALDAGLVGRTSELAAIRQILDEAANGKTRFVLLLGEAGIGKTRLLQAIVLEAGARGLRNLNGTAIESGVGLPYLPLLAPLAEATADPRVGDPATVAVRRFVRGESTAPTPDANAAARLVEAIHDVLVGTPTMLILDDIHWADESSLTVLDHLAHRARTARLAIVVAARDDDRGALDRLAIADGRRFQPIRLERLSEADVAAQIAGLTGAAPDRATVQRVYRRAAGNPFFVEQIVAAGAGAGKLPSSLELLVDRRVARLLPATRAVLGALAVIGHVTDVATIAAVAAAETSMVVAAIDEAADVGIASRDRYGSDLRHPIFREVILGELDPSIRQELHHRAALALTAVGAPVTEVASHWWLAGDPGQAWASALEAGAAAERGQAFAEAYLHLDRAIGRWPDGQPGRDEVVLRAAHAAWVSGHPAEAARLTRDCSEQGASTVEVMTAQGQYEWDAGDRVASSATFDRVADRLTEAMPARLRGRALWGVGRARVATGRHDEAAVLAEQAAAAAAVAGDTFQESEALNLFAMARAWSGRLDGIDALTRSLTMAEAAGEPSAIGHSLQFLVDLLVLDGNLDRALAVAVRGIEISDRLGLAGFHGSDLRGRAALILLERGRWDEAADVLEPADPRAFPSLARALLATRRGAFDDARSALAAAAVGGAIGGPGALGGWQELAYAELAWTAGDRPGAVAALTPPPAVPGVWALDVDARVAWWMARNAPDPALLAQRVAAAALDPDGPLARALIADIEAETSTDPVGSFTASVIAWEAAGRPYERAVARLREAGARYAAGDRLAGREALHDVSEVADTLGAVPLATLADDLGRRARVLARAVRRHEPDPGELTARELEVLQLVSDGLTNPQIAERLFVSRKTVSIHVSRILDKLDAHTRGEAAAVGRRRGLVP